MPLVESMATEVSILSFEAMVRRICSSIAAKDANDPSRRLLVVDVLSVKVHAKTTLLSLLPESCAAGPRLNGRRRAKDVLCTHPMFGPQSGKHGWGGLPFVFERVRLNNARTL